MERSPWCDGPRAPRVRVPDCFMVLGVLSAREMSVRKDETMQNLYERVLSLRVRVRYGAYLFDSGGGCGADDAIAARDRHGHVTCILYRACPKRVCARAPLLLSSPPTNARTQRPKNNTTRTSSGGQSSCTHRLCRSQWGGTQRPRHPPRRRPLRP